MKKITSYSFIALLIFLFASCSNQPSIKDWEGTYYGTLPCADCEEIITKLTLKKDMKYEMITTYVMKRGDDFIDKAQGSFEWKGDVAILSGIPTDQAFQFKVEEHQMRYLDIEGKEIENDSTDLYVLKKEQIRDVSEGSPIPKGLYGKFTGVLPCADCDGIQTDVILNEDYSYVFVSKYLTEQEFTDTLQGNFTLNGGIIYLMNNDEPPVLLGYDEDVDEIRVLDQNGEENTGKLAAYYVLEKIE